MRSMNLRLLVTLLLVMAGGTGQALPTISGGAIDPGAGDSTLRFELTGEASVLDRYTIGIFDLSRMTASAGDPDFALQALQADRVVLLHEAGQSLTRVQELNFGSGARLGVFVMRDGTLRDFSLGQAPFQPTFSLLGSPGSPFFTLAGEGSGSTLIGYQTLGAGRVRGAAMGGASGSMFGVGVSAADLRGPAPVVTPEPATLALIGLGTAAAAALGRRRKSRNRL